MCEKNYESLVHFDRDDEASVHSKAMDIAAMKLDVDDDWENDDSFCNDSDSDGDDW